MARRINGPDPGGIEARALENWQKRINTPKGNPNAPQTFINNAGNIPYGRMNQYQMYYQQCIWNGQMPMPATQYMLMAQQGLDPLATVQTGTQTIKSLTETISEITTGIAGLFKGKSSKVAPKNTEKSETIINNYQTALKNNSEFKVDNLNDFVNAQFTGMKTDGDTVTTSQYTEYLTGLGFDKEEADIIVSDIAKDSKTKGKLTKKDIKNFYSAVMGKDKTISASKIEAKLMARLEQTDAQLSKSSTETQLAAKGYKYIEIEKNGTTIGGFAKDGEFIPCSDTDKLQEIINNT